MPLGPRVVLTVSVTAMQALMLLMSCAVPWLVSVPSLSKMIWGCCTTRQVLALSFLTIEQDYDLFKNHCRIES